MNTPYGLNDWLAGEAAGRRQEGGRRAAGRRQWRLTCFGQIHSPLLSSSSSLERQCVARRTRNDRPNNSQARRGTIACVHKNEHAHRYKQVISDTERALSRFQLVHVHNCR
ncbi:hypothetical protein RJ55_07557 [Drechmeria coniospora]|nr:hypothetical protein RJ55_07557 [Drechmeria coniospora]